MDQISNMGLNMLNSELLIWPNTLEAFSRSVSPLPVFFWSWSIKFLERWSQLQRSTNLSAIQLNTESSIQIRVTIPCVPEFFRHNRKPHKDKASDIFPHCPLRKLVTSSWIMNRYETRSFSYLIIKKAATLLHKQFHRASKTRLFTSLKKVTKAFGLTGCFKNNGDMFVNSLDNPLIQLLD